MNYRADKFEAFVKKSGLKKKHIAELLKITYPTFLSKVNGKATWNLEDFKNLKKIMSKEEMNDIFFKD